jgi:hypothetical protein
VKLIRTLIDTVKLKAGGAAERPWEFEPVKKEIPIDERRAAEQAKQVRLRYSVEIVNKGEGVRYTEGLRTVEGNIAWADGARLFLNTLKQWTKPDPRDLTLSEYTKILTRIAEYLTCDATELTMVDQAPPLEIEDVMVADVVLPRVPCWRRLERDGKIVKEQQPLPQ